MVKAGNYIFFKFPSMQNASTADDNLSWLSGHASVLPATGPGDVQHAGTVLPAAASPPAEFRRKVSQQAVAVTRSDADRHRGPLHHIQQRRHPRRRRSRVRRARNLVWNTGKYTVREATRQNGICNGVYSVILKL